MQPNQAKADISRAYSTLFNFASHNVAAKTAVVQDGRALQAALTQALASSLATKATGARVTAVRLLSATDCSQVLLASPCAKVTYDLLGADNKPLFATPSTGYAVYLDGRWLVAKSTICALLELFYSASGHSGTPPGC
jgi:hypothetical protein